MEKKEVEVGNPVAIAGIILIPVEKVLLNYWHRNNSISLFAVKQPVSVVVVSTSEKRAFRITGEETSLDELVGEVPALGELLARI
ncbi:MAG: hypothetical protein ACE5LA_04855 [Dehalococcoidales bacterium]